jgi:hypothetical protein
MALGLAGLAAPGGPPAEAAAVAAEGGDVAAAALLGSAAPGALLVAENARCGRRRRGGGVWRRCVAEVCACVCLVCRHVLQLSQEQAAAFAARADAMATATGWQVGGRAS